MVLSVKDSTIRLKQPIWDLVLFKSSKLAVKSSKWQIEKLSKRPALVIQYCQYCQSILPITESINISTKKNTTEFREIQALCLQQFIIAMFTCCSHLLIICIAVEEETELFHSLFFLPLLLDSFIIVIRKRMGQPEGHSTTGTPDGYRTVNRPFSDPWEEATSRWEIHVSTNSKKKGKISLPAHPSIKQIRPR